MLFIVCFSIQSFITPIIIPVINQRKKIENCSCCIVNVVSRIVVVMIPCVYNMFMMPAQMMPRIAQTTTINIMLNSFRIFSVSYRFVLGRKVQR